MEKPGVQEYTASKKQPGSTLTLTPADYMWINVIID